ncbi:hypothetical protein RKE29_05400 [Streptomyces sp. B1866]|uniref:hypothetical protein n=1 Tax=Streptomyces sp. B1866 TaxID=3075431 RepID=UPI0028906EF6|nr:hypothetical protein [Streptomyces sp. B1866]MDT3396082.1 hypothetical protein [Streptomyces sp. B1866]
MSQDRPTLPPVRLRGDAELARDALAAPLFDRAVRLARWTDGERRVAADGDLLADDLRAAAGHLGLGGDEEALAEAADAWRMALATGVVAIREDQDEAAGGTGGAQGPGPEAEYPVVTQAEGLWLIDKGSHPEYVLDMWLDGFEAVVTDAALPFGPEPGGLAGWPGDEDGDGAADEGLPDAFDWDPEEEADFLDSVLANLYVLTALDEDPGGRAVPLPALAASVLIPGDVEEPSDELLEEVSEAMVRLDDQFRLLAPTGAVEYRPVDEALIEEVDGAGPGPRPADTPPPADSDSGLDADSGLDSDPGSDADDEDLSRYGAVRLTPLGVYAIRARMLYAGMAAPLVGELAERDADALLDALADYPAPAAHAEVEQWLARRAPDEAARALLAAARGDDERAPLRRLTCQQTLSLVGAPAEPAVREVLDDRHLGGLARVWLAEHKAADVPEPSEDMVFWLTVDTIAAQLTAEGESAELRDLVRGLVDRSGGFFDSAWRVDHPATAEVLEAMGRLHPDKEAAKEARRAAFKARSRA